MKIGVWELLVVFVVALVVIGPDKLPEYAKKLGEALRQFRKYSSLPVIVNPNAGLPEVRDGKTVYNVDADSFAEYMKEIALSGGTILGGCCGTTPEFIRRTIEKTDGLPYSLPEKKELTTISRTASIGISGTSTRDVPSPASTRQLICSLI